MVSAEVRGPDRQATRAGQAGPSVRIDGSEDIRAVSRSSRKRLPHGGYVDVSRQGVRSSSDVPESPRLVQRQNIIVGSLANPRYPSVIPRGEKRTIDEPPARPRALGSCKLEIVEG